MLEQEWNKELEMTNLSFMPIFVFASVFGILAYSVFDYYSSPEHWLSFLYMRIFVCLIGVSLIPLLKKKVIHFQFSLSVFFLLAYSFFAYGASVLEENNQLLAWNLSIVIGGFLWPYFILIIKPYKIALFSLSFTCIYLLFYFTQSSVSMSDLSINGGILLVFVILVSPLIGFLRCRAHKNNFKLRFELKGLNLELEQVNVKLQESNSTKDKFFSIIAHDLKSPFNSMLGLSELLIKNFDYYDREKQKKFILNIDKSLNKTHILLENLLLWSRSQKGTIDFNPQQINLATLVKETIAPLKQAAENKSIIINVEIGLTENVFADQNMLSTILRNLVSNAIKFTQEGGRIKVSTSIITDKNNQPHNQIAVRDNGPGVSAELKQRLLSGMISTAGTGLGLLLCKEFVEKHGGQIWLESVKGKGASFFFSIPQKI